MTWRTRDMSALKIAPPPSEGIYLGQYEWTAGDISSMQAAAKRFTALYSPDRGHWAHGYSSGHPSLDVEVATTAWEQGRIIVVQSYNLYAAVQGVTSKPIMLVECGFPDGMDSDTSYGASKVTDGLSAIIDTYTQIKAVVLWSNHASWFLVDVFPYDCLILPGTLNGAALQNVLAQRHAKIHTKVTLSDGGPHPYAAI